MFQFADIYKLGVKDQGHIYLNPIISTRRNAYSTDGVHICHNDCLWYVDYIECSRSMPRLNIFKICLLDCNANSSFIF